MVQLLCDIFSVEDIHPRPRVWAWHGGLDWGTLWALVMQYRTPDALLRFYPPQRWFGQVIATIVDGNLPRRKELVMRPHEGLAERKVGNETASDVRQRWQEVHEHYWWANSVVVSGRCDGWHIPLEDGSEGGVPVVGVKGVVNAMLKEGSLRPSWVWDQLLGKDSWAVSWPRGYCA